MNKFIHALGAICEVLIDITMAIFNVTFGIVLIILTVLFRPQR